MLDDKRLIIFDQYGNGIKIINLEENFIGINIVANYLTLNSASGIYMANLSKPDVELTKAQLIASPKDTFISSLIFNGKLYVLTKNEICIFNKN